MIPTKAINLLIELWPMLALFLIVLITLRLVYLKVNHKKFILYKELLSLSFIIYILLLFELVTSTDFESYSNNFIPFKEMFRYELFSRLFIKNVMGNVLLFIPFGFFTSYLIKTKKIYVPVILTAIISITIETTQLYIGRIFDIDDIILNIIGGIIGYLFYIFLEEIKNHLPAYLKKDWFLNTIIILIILLVLTWLINSFSINLIGG